MQNRFAALLIAALLPLLLFKWFLPSPFGQIDVWLMWLGAMVGIGLPLLYAEIGLAARSKMMPAQGLEVLTRQADVSILWRSFTWLSVALSLVIAALSIDAVSTSVMNTATYTGIRLNAPVFAIAIVMIVVSGLLSLLGRSTLIAAVILIVLSYIVSALTNFSFAPILTEATLSEWARVVVLTLASVGVGSGLYWFSSPYLESSVLGNNNKSNNNSSNKEVVSKTVWSIWMTQLVVGSVLLLLNPMSLTPISTFIYMLGVIAAAAFLIHYASMQLATRFGRFGIWIATLISIAITILLVIVATPMILSIVLLVVSIVSALILAIFSGWKMKISHMRKSLNFGSEGTYNLWRVAIRIIVPLLIIAAIIGWLV